MVFLHSIHDRQNCHLERMHLRYQYLATLIVFLSFMAFLTSCSLSKNHFYDFMLCNITALTKVYTIYVLNNKKAIYLNTVFVC